MIQRSQLLDYLNQLLKPQLFKDYCPNGLQVEGKLEVRRIVTGVTACQALLDAAVQRQADLVLVHHGYFWKGESEIVVGVKQRRLKTLLANDINLVAYHLPLDVHGELGNNVQLAKLLGLSINHGLEEDNPLSIGLVGDLPNALDGDQLAVLIEEKLGRKPLHIAGSKKIRSLAWCTGAAQGYLEKAVDAGVDAYITGEISEQTVHIAHENDIHFFSAGHHATERYGVRALGEHLAKTFGLAHEFVDIENPV